MSDALIGLQIGMPDNCRCGANVATISDGNGKHPATLRCFACATLRGAISEFTLHFIKSVAVRYGEPLTIIIRASAIVKAEGAI